MELFLIKLHVKKNLGYLCWKTSQKFQISCYFGFQFCEVTKKLWMRFTGDIRKIQAQIHVSTSLFSTLNYRKFLYDSKNNLNLESWANMKPTQVTVLKIASYIRPEYLVNLFMLESLCFMLELFNCTKEFP
jgi:hypothetical protein